MSRWARTTELLNAELPDERWQDDRYLTWLYDENPCGPGITAETEELDESGAPTGRLQGHYALIPQVWRNVEGAGPLVFSINAVTRSGTQRRGTFTHLARTVYAAAAEADKLAVVGVSNANSTPPVVNKLGFRLIGPLPVHLAFPGPRARGYASHVVDDAFLASDTFGRIAAGLDAHPAKGWTQCFTPDVLRWRLARPHMTYVMHVGPDVVAISTRTHAFGVPVAAILKLLPRRAPDKVLPAGPAITAACRYHRAPLAVYAGWNAFVRVRGVPVPVRFRPSPLNLIVRGLSPAVPQETFVLDTYEFLDADAY